MHPMIARSILFVHRALVTLTLYVGAASLVREEAAAQPMPSPASASAPAASREFTLLIYETDDVLARRNNPATADAYWTSYDVFAATLMKGEVLRGGSALDEREARIVRGGDSATRGVRGARLSGYLVIAVPTLAAAVG